MTVSDCCGATIQMKMVVTMESAFRYGISTRKCRPICRDCGCICRLTGDAVKLDAYKVNDT